jgi:hypothetical protein
MVCRQVVVAVLALGLSGAGLVRRSVAQEAGGPNPSAVDAAALIDPSMSVLQTPRQAKTGRAGVKTSANKAHAKTKDQAKLKTKTAPEALEPWAAVDPARATGVAKPPATQNDALPGVAHVVRPDEDRVSLGGKFSTSNSPNPGFASTGGLINEYNHDLGAPAALGTDAEVGVKLKF